MTTLALKLIKPTGQTYSCVKWKNQQGRWITSLISDNSYIALKAKGMPPQPPEYDGKNWEQDWRATEGCPYYDTQTGFAEPGSVLVLQDGTLNIFTDDESNGVIIEIAPGQYTGKLANISSGKLLRLDFALNNGTLQW